MALVVNHNIPALQTYNAVNATTNSLQKSIQKLSSGLRINSAADDAAGLAISEKMRAQVRGLDRAISNSQDGISMLQTAEGALSETHSILQRMRELSVQAANDTLTQQDRGYIQLEIDQLREEVTRIGNTTQFNKKKLLDGSAAALWSSDKLSTKAIINGGLRSIDQFGQKTSVEGNFVIDVNAKAGKAQVQKSDIFTIKHKDVIMDVSVSNQAGINGVSVNDIPAGDYQVSLGSPPSDRSIKFYAADALTEHLASNLSLGLRNSSSTAYDAISAKIDSINNGEVTLAISNTNGDWGTVTFKTDGTYKDHTFTLPSGVTGVTLDTATTKLTTGFDVRKLKEDMTVTFELEAATPGTSAAWAPGTSTLATSDDLTGADNDKATASGAATATDMIDAATVAFGVGTGTPAVDWADITSIHVEGTIGGTPGEIAAGELTGWYIKADGTTGTISNLAVSTMSAGSVTVNFEDTTSGGTSNPDLTLTFTIGADAATTAGTFIADQTKTTVDGAGGTDIADTKIVVGDTTYYVHSDAIVAGVTLEDLVTPSSNTFYDIPATAGFVAGDILDISGTSLEGLETKVTAGSVPPDSTKAVELLLYADSAGDIHYEIDYGGVTGTGDLSASTETITVDGVEFDIDLNGVTAVAGDRIKYVFTPATPPTLGEADVTGDYASESDYEDNLTFTSSGEVEKDAKVTLTVNKVDAGNHEITFGVSVDGKEVTSGAPYTAKLDGSAKASWEIDGLGTFDVDMGAIAATNKTISVGDAVTFEVKKNLPGAELESKTIAKDLKDSLTLVIENTDAKGHYVTAKLTQADAQTLTLTLENEGGTLGGKKLVFDSQSGELLSQDLSGVSGLKVNETTTKLDVSKLDVSKLQTGLTLNFDIEGLAGKTTATDFAATATPTETALITALNASATKITLKDANGTALNDFSFSMEALDATGSVFNIDNIVAKDLEGGAVTLAAGKYSTAAGKLKFTGVNGEAYTLEISGFTPVTTAPNDKVKVTSKVGGWTGVQTTGTTVPLDIGITTSGNFDPTLADTKVEFRADNATQVSVLVTYGGKEYGWKVVNATDNFITLDAPGKPKFEFANLPTASLTTGNITTYKLSAATAGKVNNYKEYSDYSNVTIKAANVTEGGEFELRVKEVNEDGTAASFEVYVGGVIKGSATGLNLDPDPTKPPVTTTSTVTGTGLADSITVDFSALIATAGGLPSLQGMSAGDSLKFEVTDGRSLGSARLVGRYGTDQELEINAEEADKNASILFEVVKVDDVTQSVDFKITANLLDTAGNVSTKVTNQTLSGDTLSLKASDALNLKLDLALDLDALAGGKKLSDVFKKGDKLAYNVTPAIPAASDSVTKIVEIEGQQNQDWAGSWGSSVTANGKALRYAIDSTQVDGREVHFKNFYINEKDGTVYSGDIVLDLAKDFSEKIVDSEVGAVLASFEAAYVGQVAKSDVKLRDLDKFWNSEGRFLLEDPQKLTITQGDGTTAGVTLYATDTLQDAATKLNEAIASQLGQKLLLTTDGRDGAASGFVTFVDDTKEGTSEAAAGTFVIRSAAAGTNGQLSFAGDEELLNKFSLNEIQAAEENSFTVSVWDAHDGKSVASSVKITGNKLIGVVNDNVDVVFDSMANVKVEWNEPTKSFTLSKDDDSYQTILHLADNTTVFQIGANEGEDMGVNFGDMRAEALGLNSVLVTDRDSAARSITIIDNAIDKVSMQRARIGAYQNRLEHSITNLTIAGENLTAAESRIRDTDMAKEMMNFTKLQIMLQAGTSMLAQANTLPQNVLSLIR